MGKTLTHLFHEIHYHVVGQKQNVCPNNAPNKKDFLNLLGLVLITQELSTPSRQKWYFCYLLPTSDSVKVKHFPFWKSTSEETEVRINAVIQCDNQWDACHFLPLGMNSILLVTVWRRWRILSLFLFPLFYCCSHHICSNSQISCL